MVIFLSFYLRNILNGRLLLVTEYSSIQYLSRLLLVPLPISPQNRHSLFNVKLLDTKIQSVKPNSDQTHHWWFLTIEQNGIYLPISEHCRESAATAARVKLPLGHSAFVRETTHRHTRATAQSKPAEMKQHTCQGLYFPI